MAFRVLINKGGGLVICRHTKALYKPKRPTYFVLNSEIVTPKKEISPKSIFAADFRLKFLKLGEQE